MGGLSDEENRRARTGGSGLTRPVRPWDNPDQRGRPAAPNPPMPGPSATGPVPALPPNHPNSVRRG